MEDLSDNEREEQLRRFWAENWLWIVGGIALGLGGLAGGQYWQKSRLNASEQDEASYVAVLDSLSKNDKDAAAKKAGDLRGLHPKSPYADQADLALSSPCAARNCRSAGPYGNPVSPSPPAARSPVG